jgi:hypothetical protein
VPMYASRGAAIAALLGEPRAESGRDRIASRA